MDYNHCQWWPTLSMSGLINEQTIKYFHTLLKDETWDTVQYMKLPVQQIQHVGAKFVLRLTDNQKQNRVEISNELLANVNGNENFLKSITTGDETLVYGYNVETKMQARMSRSKIKVVIFVFF
jgi:hypothetical protein